MATRKSKKIELVLGRPPKGRKARLRFVLDFFRQLTGREPTAEQIEETRREIAKHGD